MGAKKKSAKGRLDKYYHLAKDQGYRARSAFKLIQLAKRYDFLTHSRVCLDLCAAPGGWSQVAQKNMPSGSQILAIDLCPIKPIQGVTCIQSDITSDKCRSIVRKELQGAKADVVLHDGAPNVGANWLKDAYGQCELVLQATRIACEHLRQGGTYVTKVFRSADYNSLLWVFNQLFSKVDATKPASSRNVSAEIFVIATGFKAGKIDPRFFDPKWVFMETVQAEEISGTPGLDGGKGQGPSLSDLLKNRERRHRGGYEPGDDLKIISCADFMGAANAAQVLVTHHRLSLDASGSEEYAKHPLTTDEIRELCADLQVLGKRDLSTLLKWRMRIKREHMKAEKSSRKATLAGTNSEGRQVDKKKDEKSALNQDIDAAIDTLFAKDGQKEEKEDEESEVDEELERDLAEQVEKRRKEEKGIRKRTMNRQRKMEWRKKLSLGGGKEQEQQEQPELFKVNARNVQALMDEDQYIVPKDSDEEDGEGGKACEESDSDGELDRIAKMEVDLAVQHELQQIRDSDRFRNATQRKLKGKKETRRKQVLAAWSGELMAFNEALQGRASAIRDTTDAAEEEEDDEEDELAEDELTQLRKLQESAIYGTDCSSGLDSQALEALLDGGHPEVAASKNARDSRGEDVASNTDSDAESNPSRPPTALKNGSIRGSGAKALQIQKHMAASSDLALVPAGVSDDQEPLRNQRRAERWFSQDIFKHAASSSSSSKVKPFKPLDQDSEDDSASGGQEEGMREFEDSELPQLPLSDKEKRRLKRKREQEKLERAGKKPIVDEEDRLPLEVTPLQPPKPLVQLKKGPQKPTDPRELAETLALGSLLVASKKSRMDVIDASYNRWTFDHDETLPVWFTEDENKNNKPELPITKEMMAEFRAKLKEINARPIRKVVEAKARKRRRLSLRLEKLRSTAMGMAENGDMTEAARARAMRKEVSALARQEQRRTTVVAIKKGGGGHMTGKGRIPKGAKTKVVDRRMKSDIRAQKRAAKKNPGKHKQAAKKFMRKQSKRRTR